MWAKGSKEESLTYLRNFAASLTRAVQAESSEQSHSDITKLKIDQKLDELSRLLARCYLKQGEWQVALEEGWGSVCDLSVLLSHDADLCRREISKTYFGRISSRLIMTLAGTRLGIHGLLPTLMSLAISRTRQISGVRILPVKIWHLTSSLLLKVRRFVLHIDTSLIITLGRLLPLYFPEERKRSPGYSTTLDTVVQVRRQRRSQPCYEQWFH